MKKIGNSFKGILGGLILIVIGIIVLWWNEGNNVKNMKTTAEMDKSVIDITSDKIDSSNEGKLVATSGQLVNKEELTDMTFQVKVVTPVMKRIVEVYQWKEDSDIDDDGNTTYHYKKAWSNDLIDSSSFHQSGHENPQQKAYENEKYTASNVKLGAFTLSSNQLEMLSTKTNYKDYDEETISKLGMTISNQYITTSTDIDNPKIGDVRISFVYNNSKEISVLAVQKGSTFVSFVSKEGKSINRIMEGTHSGTEMINAIKQDNKLIKWLLRLVGTILIIGGIGAILGPISTISSFIPILGNIVGIAVGFVSFILGLSISLIIIALAWIRFRPILGISLIIAVVLLMIFLIKRGKKAKEVPQIENQNNQP